MYFEIMLIMSSRLTVGHTQPPIPWVTAGGAWS